MPTGSEQAAHTLAIVLGALAASLATIVFLLAVIVVRRWLRARYFHRRDERVVAVRQSWDDIVSGEVPPQTWTSDPLTREVVETLLLDMLEGARGGEMQPLIECLRRSGLLDDRIAQARRRAGWKRRAALVSLGRTRAPEALPALTEALNSNDTETVIAAMRGIGRIAQPHAADPVLRKLTGGTLQVPLPVLKNTLISCCREAPGILLPFLNSARHETRETLARILGELADTAEMPELLVMSADPIPEVRASAARGLARLEAMRVLGPLWSLAADSEWFVRLRAVVALGMLRHVAAIPVLVRALCDSQQQVRQRAAWALLNFDHGLAAICSEAVATGDNYALQALIAELDSTGRLEEAWREVQNSRLRDRAEVIEAMNAALYKLGRRAPLHPQEVA